MSSVLDLHGAVIMSKHDAEKLVRAIEALSYGSDQGLAIRAMLVYQHLGKYDALGVFNDLRDLTRPREDLEP